MISIICFRHCHVLGPDLGLFFYSVLSCIYLFICVYVCEDQCARKCWCVHMEAKTQPWVFSFDTVQLLGRDLFILILYVLVIASMYVCIPCVNFLGVDLNAVVT